MSESKLQINGKKDDPTDNACPEVSNVSPYKITKREKKYLTSFGSVVLNLWYLIVDLLIKNTHLCHP
jgi:hypothetical protein